MRSQQTVKLAKMSMLAAISIVLVLLVVLTPLAAITIFPMAPFLKYDPADVPILMGTFAFGPAAGLLITAVVSLIQGIIVGDFPIGPLMHFLATGSFVITAGLIYKKNKSKKSALIGLVFGTLAMTIVMVLWNLIFTPIYMGVPREMVVGILAPAIIPFNLLKAGVNSILTFVLYKRISSYLHK